MSDDGQHARVRVRGDRQRGVPEELGDDLQRDAGTAAAVGRPLALGVLCSAFALQPRLPSFPVATTVGILCGAVLPAAVLAVLSQVSSLA